MARHERGPTVVGAGPSSDFAHRVFCGDRMRRWNPADGQASWQQQAKGSASGANVYDRARVRPRPGGGADGDATLRASASAPREGWGETTTTGREGLNAADTLRASASAATLHADQSLRFDSFTKSMLLDTGRSFGHAELAHVGRDERFHTRNGLDAAAATVATSRATASGRGAHLPSRQGYHEGPLNYHRRPATAGALRPRSTLQYSRTLPNGAPARAAPGEADDVAGVAPPSAWTRSQVFGGHAATQDMDGVARPVHKEVHVRKPVTYERMRNPALAHTAVKPFSRPYTARDRVPVSARREQQRREQRR